MSYQKSLQTLAKALCVYSVAVSAAQALTYQGPIIVNDAYVKTNGTVITGNFMGTLTQPAITVATLTPITIVNSNLTGPGDLIYATGANITVTNTTGIGTNPNQTGVAKGMFLHVDCAANVVVKNCNIQNTSYGVYIHRYVGNYTPSQTIKILNNLVSNIDGRPSNGSNGYVTSGSFSTHTFQLDTVQAVPNMEIAWNQIINQPRQSQVNANIEILSSSGTPSSHLLIHDNYIQGAYPVQPGVDKYSGGGIVLNGTSTDSTITSTAYVDIYNNQMVSSSNHGMAIAAGHDNSIYNNRVISNGHLSDGTISTEKNAVGMYNWNLYNASFFANNLVHDNLIGLVGINSSGVLQRNDYWFPGQNNQQANNVDWTPFDSTHPTLADEANEFQLWQTKVTNNAIHLGP